MGRILEDMTSFLQGGSRYRLTALVAALAAGMSWSAPTAFADDKVQLLIEVHFDPGSADVTLGGQKKIEQAIAKIAAQSPREIHVIGFADSTGDAAINRTISRERADNVASMLAESGVTLPLVIEGRGEDGAPYAIPDDTSEPLNRCVGILAVGSRG